MIYYSYRCLLTKILKKIYNQNIILKKHYQNREKIIKIALHKNI